MGIIVKSPCSRTELTSWKITGVQFNFDLLAMSLYLTLAATVHQRCAIICRLKLQLLRYRQALMAVLLAVRLRLSVCHMLFLANNKLQVPFLHSTVNFYFAMILVSLSFQLRGKITSFFLTITTKFVKLLNLSKTIS